MAQVIDTTLSGAGFNVPARLTFLGDRIRIKSAYNPFALAEIKAMERPANYGGYHPETKEWDVLLTEGNLFKIANLLGKNPYARFDSPLERPTTKRTLYEHQYDMLAHCLQRRTAILACEMGTGKTLVALELIEKVKEREGAAWFIGPKSALLSVYLEIDKWGVTDPISLYTYDRLVQVMRDWTDGAAAPQIVIFDESSMIKNASSKRSQAAAALAKAVRTEWKDKAYVILMTGTPAPRVPTDWFAQCQTACPGFLKEGTFAQFRNRLAVIEQVEDPVTGAKYPKIICWKDHDDMCNICGATEQAHKDIVSHTYEPAKNEIAILHKRLDGLVYVVKKDCLSLPDKIFQIIQIPSTAEIVQLAYTIKKTETSPIRRMEKIRQLSDGFLYTKVDAAEQIVCPVCVGEGIQRMPRILNEQTAPWEPPEYGEMTDVMCETCQGTGKITPQVRTENTVVCPKDDFLFEELEALEDVGRCVVWAGYQGTIDRLIPILLEKEWAVLRYDGKAVKSYGTDIPSMDLLKAMDRSHKEYESYREKVPKLVFLGNPAAGGMGLTLTASPVAIYYSNTFSGQAFFQSIDRIHRAGMDPNRAALIKLLIHLPEDVVVLKNLVTKKVLQDITLGDLDTPTDVGDVATMLKADVIKWRKQ